MKSTTGITAPNIKLPKANLVAEVEMINIAKLIDPKINLAASKSVPGKTSMNSSGKNFTKQFENSKSGHKKGAFVPLFSSTGKSGVESDDKPLKVSKYVPKGTPTKTATFKSTTIGVTKRLNSTIMNSSSNINSFVKRQERTEESSAEFSCSLLRQQKSLNMRTGSPPFQRGKVFEASFNKQKPVPTNNTKRPALKRPSPPKKGSLGNKGEIRNFKLEYLREEKLSRLSESQYGFDQEEAKKANARGPGSGGGGLQSPKGAVSKLQQARLQQNLMHNVGVP
jgi:hypothetical protein